MYRLFKENIQRDFMVSSGQQSYKQVCIPKLRQKNAGNEGASEKQIELLVFHMLYILLVMPTEDERSYSEDAMDTFMLIISEIWYLS